MTTVATAARDHTQVARQSEAALIAVTARRLRNDWPTRAIGLEVRSHGRARTDICVRVRDLCEAIGSDLVVGIEVKLTDWNRALRQAALNRYAVDASMIAMPASRLNETIVRAADDYGVGVLALRPRAIEVVVPATASCPDAALHARIVAQLVPVRARGKLKVNQIVKGR